VGLGRGLWRFLRHNWPLLAVAALGRALPCIAHNYNGLQTASTWREFVHVLSDTKLNRAKSAVNVDFVFAAGYGAVALLYASRVNAPALRVIARLASCAVVGGAVLDEVENWRLRYNLGHLLTIDDEHIRRISGAGTIKNSLAYGGGAVLLAVLLAAWLSNGGTMSIDTRLFALRARLLSISAKARRWTLFVGAAFIAALLATILIARPALLATIGFALLIQLALFPLLALYRVEAKDGGAGWLSKLHDTIKAHPIISALVVGAIVVAVWALGAKRDSGVLIYAALAAAYIGVNALGSRWRRDPARPRGTGLTMLRVAAVVGVLSLVIATVNVDERWLIPAGLALILLLPAIGFLAEDRARSDTDLPITRAAWGAAAIAAGLALLSLADIGAAQAVIGTIVLIVLVVAVAANTAHDAVIVLLAVALLWSLNPKPGPDERDHDPRRNEDVIVTLGDSYMAGEGSDTFFQGTSHDHGKDNNTCRRAPTAYPFKVQEQLRYKNEKLGLLDVACAGARTKNVKREAQHPSEPVWVWSAGKRTEPNHGTHPQTQLAQAEKAIRLRHLHPKLVLVSVGGNDAGFSKIGAACGLAGDCSVIGQEFLDNLDPQVSQDRIDAAVRRGEEPPGVRLKVRDAYREIKQAFRHDNPHILVVPYPIPVNEAGCRLSVLRPNEHRFITGFARALDQVLKDEATREGLDFLDHGPDAFTVARKRICDVAPSKAAANQLAASPVEGFFLKRALPKSWFHSTFHPTALGHELLANTIVDWVKDNPIGTAAPAPNPGVTTMPVPDISGIMGKGFDFCGSAIRSPATCHLDSKAWSAGAMTRLLWTVFVPIALIVWGALEWAIVVMRRWRFWAKQMYPVLHALGLA
jgi:lysophospholipase L1-like esterase